MVKRNLEKRKKEMVRDGWKEPGESGYHFSQNDKGVKDLFAIKCNRAQSPKLKNTLWRGCRKSLGIFIKNSSSSSMKIEDSS